MKEKKYTSRVINIEKKFVTINDRNVIILQK